MARKIKSVAQVYASKPDWVNREISGPEAAILARMIIETGATCGAEVGVASGFSSSIIFGAMGRNTDSPQLHSFDISPECYFDKDRMTGDAFKEIHGPQPGWKLNVGKTTADIVTLPPLDFMFIDGHHGTPWPALDVLSLARFLKPDGWIALDDVELTFVKRWQLGGKNGARDLFRAWRGKKVRYKGATTLAILYATDVEQLLRSTVNSMMCDWDVALSQDDMAKFVAIARHYGDARVERLLRVMEGQNKSYRRVPPHAPPSADYLTIPQD